MTDSGNCSVAFSDEIGSLASVLLPPLFLLGDEGAGPWQHFLDDLMNILKNIQKSKSGSKRIYIIQMSRSMGEKHVIQHKSSSQTPLCSQPAPDRDLKCWASIFKRSRSVLNVANISALVGVGPFSTAFSVAFSQTSFPGTGLRNHRKSPGNDH